MDITPLIPSNRKIITGYGGGSFKISAENIEGSVIILQDTIIKWSIVTGDITLESLLPIIENLNKNSLDIELLIIGCGETHQRLSAEIHNAFRAKHINVEIMTTGAACRTYNVLLGEERKIAAALIAV